MKLKILQTAESIWLCFSGNVLIGQNVVLSFFSVDVGNTLPNFSFKTFVYLHKIITLLFIFLSFLLRINIFIPILGIVWMKRIFVLGLGVCFRCTRNFDTYLHTRQLYTNRAVGNIHIFLLN